MWVIYGENDKFVIGDEITIFGIESIWEVLCVKEEYGVGVDVKESGFRTIDTYGPIKPNPIKSINDTDDYKQWLLLILAYKQNINRTSQEFISVMQWFPAIPKDSLCHMQGKNRFEK